jgi:hypothetical protein
MRQSLLKIYATDVEAAAHCHRRSGTQAFLFVKYAANS